MANGEWRMANGEWGLFAEKLMIFEPMLGKACASG